MKRLRIGAVTLLVLLIAAFAVWAGGQKEPASQTQGATVPQGFSWKKYSGQTIVVLANNNPMGQMLQKYADKFKEQTGIEADVSLFSEQQFRQRLQTILQSKSDQVDVYMSLVSREGKLYSKAGWYTDLLPFVHNSNLTSPDYNFSDFGSGVIKSKTVDGHLTGIPMNIAGPVLYYRTDVFQKCGISPPKTLEDLATIARKIKSCEPNMVPFASRGLAPALAYTFSNFLHNFGGTYENSQGMSNLSSPEGVKAIEYYASLLKDYGPPGVINYSFPQLTSLYTNGQAVMDFQASGQFPKLMESGARTNDTAVMVLPPGPAGSTPVVIGWELSISSYSQKKDAAWYFVQWATSKDMQVTLALNGLSPSRGSVLQDPKYLQWLNQSPVRKQWASSVSTLAQSGSAILSAQILLQPQARQILGEAIGSVVLGQATAAEAAKKADEQIDALIKQGQNQ